MPRALRTFHCVKVSRQQGSLSAARSGIFGMTVLRTSCHSGVQRAGSVVCAADSR